MVSRMSELVGKILGVIGVIVFMLVLLIGAAMVGAFPF